MAPERNENSQGGVLHGLASIGTRAASFAARPVTGAVGAAVGAGLSLERRAVDRVLESDELERVVVAALDSEPLQMGFKRALESDGARQLVDSFFDSGLFDRLLERLATSDGLWKLVDDIAGSPAVTAAISQQGLGFADQVGGEVRARTRRADDWLERAAKRLTNRQPKAPTAEPDASAP
jgi:hypothetical protein